MQQELQNADICGRLTTSGGVVTSCESLSLQGGALVRSEGLLEAAGLLAGSNNGHGYCFDIDLISVRLT